MGSHNSHEKAGSDQPGSGASTPRGSTKGSRSGSSGDIEKPEPPQQTSMVPVEKLAKLLVQRSQKEDGINGVTEKSFTKYLFPMYPELARAFFKHMHRAARCRDRHIPLAAFRLQCERVLAVLDDRAVLDTYVRIFSSDPEEATVTAEDFRNLLYISYKLSMDHYPEGPRTCLLINKTLTAVVKGCFNNKESHSVGFVVRWLEEHCRRIVFPVHRYCVHMLATRHRELEAQQRAAAERGEGGEGGGEGAGAGGGGEGAGIELATPVLERCAWGGAALLPPSAAWLLAATAPPLYCRPQRPPPQHPGGTTASAAWLARLVCALPSHWTPLYASREHGLGANRFLHHVLAYRGPTLALLAGGGATLAVCAPREWRESHHYQGDADSALLQLYPTLCLVEQAPRMLYLNLSARGYPRGLRAGSDPRRPLLDVHEDFDRFTYQGATYRVDAIEVWGCGDQASRETQLEIKKWQVKEAERQRQVKISAADWIEHPDRYLLELAGRPQYNNSAS